MHRADYPPTLIVVHPKENRKKCTVQPLRGRSDFLFRNFGSRGLPDLSGYVRLGIGGPPLGPRDRDKGLLVLDGSWRYAKRMAGQFADVPVRSLPDWKTAYPRNSKLFDDPPEGMATIEAIYLAYRVLGRDTAGLLDEYRWAEEFLARNEAG